MSYKMMVHMPQFVILSYPPGERVLPAKIFSHGQTPYSALREVIWDMAMEQFVDCIPVTAQYTRYLEYVIIKEKFKL